MLDIEDEAPPDLIDVQIDQTNDHGPGLIRKVPISIITGKAKSLGLHISRIRMFLNLHSHTMEYVIIRVAETLPSQAFQQCSVLVPTYCGLYFWAKRRQSANVG